MRVTKLIRDYVKPENSILISLEIGEASKDELKGILDALEV